MISNEEWKTKYLVSMEMEVCILQYVLIPVSDTDNHQLDITSTADIGNTASYQLNEFFWYQ